MRISLMATPLMLGALIALGGPQPIWASTTRHDGTVEAVDAKAQTVVIREYGANARAHDFRVHLAPNARVALSERNSNAADAQHEFTNTPIRLSDVNRGDFVVISVTGRGPHAEGESVLVTRRAGP
jgi:hypothetical protein